MAVAKVEALTVDPDGRLVITPLIRHEIMRGVPHSDGERASRLSSSLAAIDSLDITDEISDLASALFRLDRHERGPTEVPVLDKRRFDVFHFAAAKCYGLEFISEDAGMATPESLHARLADARDSRASSGPGGEAPPAG